MVSRKEKLDWERKAVTRHYRLFPFFLFLYTVLVFFPFFSRLSNNGHACLFPFLSKSGMSRYRSSVVGESTEAEKCRCVVVCVNVRMGVGIDMCVCVCVKVCMRVGVDVCVCV